MKPLAALALCLSLAASAFAADPPVADAPKPAAPAAALRATITAVNGFVQSRTAPDQPWQPVKVGAVYDVGVELRTGPRSAVSFTIPPDQSITLDRLGTIKILQAISDGGAKKITTDLGMKYGRTNYKIEEGGVEHESTIRSPGSTLAVRGSDVTTQFDAFASFAVGQGHLRYMSRLQREAVAFGGTGVKSKVTTDRMSPGGNARAAATVDARGTQVGRTRLESLRTEQHPEVGGEDYREIRDLQSQTLAFATSVGIASVPGPLTFTLDWQSTNSTPSLVQLAVRDPGGNVVSAANPTVGVSPLQAQHSGTTTADTFGEQVVQWSLFFPHGTYQVSATQSGGDAQVFLVVTKGPLLKTVKTVGIDTPLILSNNQVFTTNVGVR
jgi:hypothetical protein